MGGLAEDWLIRANVSTVDKTILINKFIKATYYKTNWTIILR
ncbi:hypothetical protein LLB_1054 [Legionella longbeachae D-4968]|nr:hypothetical protein LLB_1054 [Legionella longbeachae D-4968]